MIKQSGMVRYAQDINADHSDRVGEKPVQVVASGVGDRRGAVILITENDARLVLSSDSTKEAIKNGKVVIVID